MVNSGESLFQLIGLQQKYEGTTINDGRRFPGYSPGTPMIVA